MSRRAVSEWTCDRCGLLLLAGGSQPHDWSRLLLFSPPLMSPAEVGPPGERALSMHLCPGCTASVRQVAAP